MRLRCLNHKVEVLAEDLAKPLREKMGSSQYTDVLLAACFQETVDATKVEGCSDRLRAYSSRLGSSPLVTGIDSIIATPSYVG